MTAQLKINVTELNICQVLRPNPSTFSITDKGDTLRNIRDDDNDYPCWTAKIKLKNISDTTMILSPSSNSSYMFFSFYYEGARYKSTIYYTHIDYDISFYSKLKLYPNHEFNFEAQGCFLEFYTEDNLPLFNKLRNTKDFTNFLLQVLPTLRFEYHDANGISTYQSEVMDVKIKPYN